MLDHNTNTECPCHAQPLSKSISVSLNRLYHPNISEWASVVSSCSCQIGWLWTGELLDGTPHSQTGKTRQREAKSLDELCFPLSTDWQEVGSFSQSRENEEKIVSLWESCFTPDCRSNTQGCNKVPNKFMFVVKIFHVFQSKLRRCSKWLIFHSNCGIVAFICTESLVYILLVRDGVPIQCLNSSSDSDYHYSSIPYTVKYSLCNKMTHSLSVSVLS